MRISKKLSALCAFFIVIAVVVAGCGSSSNSLGDASVANVAGNAIPTHAWTHWMYVGAKDEAAQEQGEPVIVPSDPPKFTSCIKQIRTDVASLAKTPDSKLRADCKEIFTELNTEVLSFLVEGYWYQADVHLLHLPAITSKKVAAELEKERKASSELTSAAGLAAYLKESGQTIQDLRWQVRVNLAYQSLIKHYTKKITTPAVDAYYKANLSKQFTVPESRNIRLVRTTSLAKAQSAYNALKGGASWQSVVNQYSVGVSKANGGLVSNVTSGKEENALNKVIFSAPLNKIEGPVNGILGKYVVEVVKITPATTKTLAEAKADIKSLLLTKYQTEAKAAVLRVSKKHWGASTICRSAYSVAVCHGYVAPKTTTTATTTPAATTAATTATTTATKSTATKSTKTKTSKSSS